MFEKALEIMQRIGDEPVVARQYGNLGICYGEKGDVARELESYRKSLDIKERIGDRHGAANTYYNLGGLYRDEIDDRGQARAHFEKAKALFDTVGDVPHAQQAAVALRQL